MPTLRFHAVSSEKLLTVYNSLIKELKIIFQVPEDYFNIEIIKSEFISEGEIKDGFPLVEVCAFKREDNVQDEAAKCISAHLRTAGYHDSEVYFTFPEKRYYYGNGEHY